MSESVAVPIETTFAIPVDRIVAVHPLVNRPLIEECLLIYRDDRGSHRFRLVEKPYAITAAVVDSERRRNGASQPVGTEAAPPTETVEERTFVDVGGDHFVRRSNVLALQGIGARTRVHLNIPGQFIDSPLSPEQIADRLNGRRP